MIIGYERVIADATVKTATAFSIPDRATRAIVQCEDFNVRFTMDNATDPSASVGFLMQQGTWYEFPIEDFKRIRFTVKNGGTNQAPMNIHYATGRDV